LLVWWKYQKDLYDIIWKLTSYCVEKDAEWYKWYWPVYTEKWIPIFVKKWEYWSWFYMDLRKETINKYVKSEYKWCFFKTLKKIFWIDFENFDYDFFPWIKKITPNYIVVSSSNRIWKSKLFSLWTDSELKDYFLTFVTDEWVILIPLKASSKTLSSIWASSFEEALKEKERYEVIWKIQIDSFLIKWCAKKFFEGSGELAQDALIKKERNKCWLVQIDLDWEWNKELILVDTWLKISLIYWDFEDNLNWFRVIKPIFKSNDKIIKFLPNWSWYFDSFLAVD